MREKILETAGEMFLNYGFKSITMDDIANEMGISKKTIYKYYSNKVDLVDASTEIVKKTIETAITEITEKNLGITLVVEKKRVVGIFTDGDLRRCIGNKMDINNTIIKEVMTINFKSVQADELAIDAAKIMESNKIFTLVVFDSKKAIGVISMHDLLQSGIV